MARTTAIVRVTRHDDGCTCNRPGPSPCHRKFDAARRRLTGERTSPRRGGGGDV